MNEIKIYTAGDSSVLIEFGQEISPEINAQITALVRLIKAQHIEGVTDMIPAFASLLINYDPRVVSYAGLRARLEKLLKLEIVKKVELLTDENSVSSELLLLKVRAKGIEKKNALLEINRKYGARIIDVTLESFTLELTGRPDTIDEFIGAVSDFGIIEMARTGATSLERGSESFSEDL